TLRVLGRKGKSFDEIVSYVGTGVSDLIAKSLDTDDDSLVEKGVEIYSKHMLEHPARNAKVYPHVKETLEFFKDKRKFVLTNRYAKFADVVLNALGLGKYFEDIFGGDDESCIKPSACVLGTILPRLKIDKSKAIIVGDMSIDIMTGKNSGVRTCWVTYGLGSAEEVKDLKPDYVIDDIAQLKKIVK
ncbi:MAG: HAD-IA family hydrolase, partial [Candidatus Omnitrophica bacterium]|nr:HAD-IA family hydrolase [Candidatus Omnitrophota bacterium]